MAHSMQHHAEENNLEQRAMFLSEDEISLLSEKERGHLRKVLLEQLRRLSATFRSDWHAGLEACLRIDAGKAENGHARVEAEHRLGEEPPRVDFIVWLQDEGTHMLKAIYNIFRKFNIIEFKNPHAQLNWRVIRKTIGYAYLYLGMADNENDRPVDQITVSIFRAVKNPELFKELEEHGMLVADATKGIYHVVGLTEFPFQIVIMTELEGDEYAAERAMIDDNRASVEDLKIVADEYKNETDDAVKDHLGVLLRLISNKNPEVFDEVKRRYPDMSPRLFEIMKPEIEARDKERDKNNFFIFVQDGQMTPEYAAGRIGQPVKEFITEMEKSGYSISSHTAVAK